MTEVELAIKYLENMVNSDYWKMIEYKDDFREIGENILILTKELKSNSTLKDKIRNCINEYEKEIKTYEDKMVEISQREKYHAIENKDFINYSCIISNFTDKIKLLKELLGEE